MKEDGMFTIQVPGSTANLGPGYDSIGLAVNLYLTVQVERSDEWQVLIQSKELMKLPTDENNLMIQVAKDTATQFGKLIAPCKLNIKSNIPLARGLGSSAAAIIAGIELADQVAHLQLNKQEKFKIASTIEGHPDNVGASLFGGLVIGSQLGDDVHAVIYQDLKMDLVACVPQEELFTEESRAVLPKEWPFETAVLAGGISNVLVASLLTGNYELAGKMMGKDLYHQPYRRKLVPHFSMIEELALSAGAFGVALSGAGPTVMCFCKKGKGTFVKKLLNQKLPDLTYYELAMDSFGSRIYKGSYQWSKNEEVS